jgi:hypothetical protein
VTRLMRSRFSLSAYWQPFGVLAGVASDAARQFREADVRFGSDAVEKVGFPIGVMLLSDFDPAEVSRLLVLLCGGLDADATAACLSDFRQTMRAAGRVVAPVFGAPRS